MENSVVHVIAQVIDDKEVPFYVIEAFTEMDMAKHKYDIMEAMEPDRYRLFLNVRFNSEEIYSASNY